MSYEKGSLLYSNALSSEEDVKGFVMEGDGVVTFPHQRMRIENLRPPEDGQKANTVFWCPETFPANISISWQFWPIREPGLCILFFAAKGQGGEHVLNADLQKRTGEYSLYHHGDINAYHVSYFRRKYEEERAFQTVNLRKSYGFHMVTQGPDPLPAVLDARPPYTMELYVFNGEVSFHINTLEIFRWQDDGVAYGSLLEGGSIGFRQMAPLIAEYANLQVHELR
ncbi:DUF1961 family protein [Aureibacillus halotolerans]|uniref:Uncharacterized protein DUF1961 n=1 Tax=Aureibacillus halotolerans TaxID=1508390 RepID=A0A4R6U2R1_9BACI|nr:DUF1961 family protein [Aureibacillus halotolerans]TDQ37404.1 uncharacterized protein DUF1961 [Aureibacillus halotolerans]